MSPALNVCKAPQHLADDIKDTRRNGQLVNYQKVYS